MLSKMLDHLCTLIILSNQKHNNIEVNSDLGYLGTI